MRIFNIGDIQYRCKEQYLKAKKKLNYLQSIRIQSDDVLLIPGDLTDYGENGLLVNRLVDYVVKLFNKKAGIPFFNKELSKFKEEFYEPLHKLFNGRVYMCHGNHDEIPYIKKPVLDFIKEKHGSLDYMVTFIQNDSNNSNENQSKINLIVLGKQYTKSKKDLLMKFLKQIDLNDPNEKIIIMQHYCLLIDSPFYWWKDEDVNSFISLIKPYAHKILCIMEGHHHESYDDRYFQIDSNTKIKLVNGSGFSIQHINCN